MAEQESARSSTAPATGTSKHCASNAAQRCMGNCFEKRRSATATWPIRHSAVRPLSHSSAQPLPLGHSIIVTQAGTWSGTQAHRIAVKIPLRSLIVAGCCCFTSFHPSKLIRSVFCPSAGKGLYLALCLMVRPLEDIQLIMPNAILPSYPSPPPKKKGQNRLQ